MKLLGHVPAVTLILCLRLLEDLFQLGEATSAIGFLFAHFGETKDQLSPLAGQMRPHADIECLKVFKAKGPLQGRYKVLKSSITLILELVEMVLSDHYEELPRPPLLREGDQLRAEHHTLAKAN